MTKTCRVVIIYALRGREGSRGLYQRLEIRTDLGRHPVMIKSVKEQCRAIRAKNSVVKRRIQNDDDSGVPSAAAALYYILIARRTIYCEIMKDFRGDLCAKPSRAAGRMRLTFQLGYWYTASNSAPRSLPLLWLIFRSSRARARPRTNFSIYSFNYAGVKRVAIYCARASSPSSYSLLRRLFPLSPHSHALAGSWRNS